ncbi:MAG: 50S ribosomal protein L6 [Chloroflexi bacterium]|nr:50S ribosomal protein L6 [Chloroflexota bacterium]
MSRVGNKPIPIPQGVDVELEGSTITVRGSRGALAQTFNADMSVLRENGELRVVRPTDNRTHRALHGLTRALLSNMVIGVSDGYRRTLDLVGAGYRAQQSAEKVVLQVGYSHPVEITPLPGITLEVEGNNRIHVDGIDKQIVGEMAAQIRRVRRPNAYTGKGIRYSGERVRLKPGKAAGRKK